MVFKIKYIRPHMLSVSKTLYLEHRMFRHVFVWIKPKITSPDKNKHNNCVLLL